jgi:hypothetical protein
VGHRARAPAAPRDREVPGDLTSRRPGRTPLACASYHHELGAASDDAQRGTGKQVLHEVQTQDIRGQIGIVAVFGQTLICRPRDMRLNDYDPPRRRRVPQIQCLEQAVRSPTRRPRLQHALPVGLSASRRRISWTRSATPSPATPGHHPSPADLNGYPRPVDSRVNTPKRTQTQATEKGQIARRPVPDVASAGAHYASEMVTTASSTDCRRHAGQVARARRATTTCAAHPASCSAASRRRRRASS